jgi:hypothetical protein
VCVLQVAGLGCSHANILLLILDTSLQSTNEEYILRYLFSAMVVIHVAISKKVLDFCVVLQPLYTFCWAYQFLWHLAPYYRYEEDPA